MTTSSVGGTGAHDVPVEPTPRSIAGRDAELDRLHRALNEASQGRGSVLLVSGDAGIGKSTLLEAFSRDAAHTGARVAWGRCWEAGGAPAYWPWVQALRAALALPEVADEVEPVRPFLDVVATLVPEIAGPGNVSKPRAIEGDHERFVLFDAISRVLVTIGGQRPLVIVLDDLHAADVSSLLLLRFVGRDVRSSGCLIVGAYREREAQMDPVAGEMLAEVAKEGDAIALQGLDPHSLDSVLQLAAGAAPSDALLASLHQITDGNPFYATEIIRLLLREGQLETKLDLTRRGLPVPDSVSDTVLKRLHGLHPEVRSILHTASVLGRDFSLSPLATVTGLSAGQLRSRLGVAEQERIVRATSSDSYIFDHGLIREALYESLSDEERTTTHAKVAAALEAQGVEESGENLAEIAHHYLRASLDDARPPFEYAVRAAERAVDVMAYEQAVELFEEAVALSGPAGAEPVKKSALLRGLGEALLRSGRITEAKERLMEAAGVARSCGANDQLAAAAITYGYVPVEGGIVDAALIELIQEALDAIDPAPSRERALLLARWAHELMLSGEKRDLEKRDRMSAEALQMIREYGDQRDVARVLRNRFSVILSPARLAESLAVADEVLQIGLAIRDTEIEIVGRIRRAAVLMSQGRTAELVAEYQAMERLADQVRQPLYTSPVAFFRACLTGMKTDPATATKASDAAMAVGPDVPNAMGAHLLQHLSWRWQTDGGGDFEPFLRVAVEQRPGVRRTWNAAVAATVARVGRRQEAALLLDELVQDLPQAPVDSTYMALLHCLAETMRILRESSGAKTVYDALLPFRDQQIVQVMVAPVTYYGSVEWDLGTLAALTEEWDLAQQHLERAVEHHARMAARTQLAWTQIELGYVLLRRGDHADRARSLVQEGLRTAEELGLEILQAWTADSLELTEVPQEPATDQPSRARMVKEGDYVTITSGEEVVRLRESKGIGYLAALLGSPGQELHVLDVASPRSPGQAVTREDALDVGAADGGSLLDPAAKAAYKIRVEELRAELDEAESFNDVARASQAKAELQFISDELAGAVGLGGRDRKMQTDAERARVNVTKRIKNTIDKIASGAPRLGRHLEASIKTGTYLSYSDRLEPTLEWDIQLK